MLTVGTIVGDEDSSSEKWTVLGFLGRGTCCEVYQVQSLTDPQMRAALKVYKEGLKYERAHDGEVLLLDLVTRASGPSKQLVKTITDFDYSERPCIVQELLDLDMRQLMSKVHGRGLSVFLIQKLTRDIMKGLHHLHKSGFVHGDIKPTNLMWCPREYCMKIIDFSLSYHVQDESIGLLQSQGYRAPETERWNTYCSKQSECRTGTNDILCGVIEQNSNIPDVIDPGGGAPAIQNSSHVDQKALSGSDLGLTGSIMEAVKSEALAFGTKSEVCPETARTLLLAADLCSDGSEQCPLPTRAADIWSVGCVMLEMLFGAKVFTAAKLALVQQNQRKGICLSDCLIKTVDDVVEQSIRGYDTRDMILMKQFINRCLSVNAHERWSAEEALKHELLTNKYIPGFEDLCVLNSPVIRLLNVVEVDDLTDREKYEEVEEELREECQKYGDIISCVMPRSGDGAGKIYVEYGTWQQAEFAYGKLCHRIYNNHDVIVTYFSVDDFRSQNYF